MHDYLEGIGGIKTDSGCGGAQDVPEHRYAHDPPHPARDVAGERRDEVGAPGTGRRSGPAQPVGGGDREQRCAVQVLGRMTVASGVQPGRPMAAEAASEAARWLSPGKKTSLT